MFELASEMFERSMSHKGGGGELFDDSLSFHVYWFFVLRQVEHGVVFAPGQLGFVLVGFRTPAQIRVKMFTDVCCHFEFVYRQLFRERNHLTKLDIQWALASMV